MRELIVGGAVRDKLMGKVPEDIDWVVVGSTQADINVLLNVGYEQVGKDFPVFLHPVTGEEYALARRERKVGVGHTGFSVEANETVTLEDDLSRRDLTINSMAEDPATGEIIDPFGGQQDLRDGVLRHTTDAFAEDPLRVIRLARFAARFPHFTIHPETEALVKRMVESGQLNELPAERFAAEVVKVLKGSNSPARFFEVLKEFGVDQHVKFFQHVDLAWAAKVAEAVFKFYSDDSRVEVFAVLVSADDAFTVKVGGAESLRLRDLLALHWTQGGGATKAERLESICAACGYQTMDRVRAHADHVWMDTNLGIEYEFRPWQLEEAFKKLAAVSSELGPRLKAEGRSGKEIGDAIKARRLEIARSLVSST